MKTNTKTPKTPLVRGMVLHRSTVALGATRLATLIVTYDGPSESAPRAGSVWPPETDWPAAQLTVTLPNRHNGDSACQEHLHCACSVAGAQVGYQWGHGGGVVGAVRQRRMVGESLRGAAAALLREVRGELAMLAAHVRAREARLAQREATLLAGQDMAPLRTA